MAKAKGGQSAREARSEARPATSADIEPACAMLARAFADDPMMCFLLQDEATRDAKLPRLFKLLFKLALPLGGCDVAEGYESAAIWRPPGHAEMPFYQYLTNGVEFLSLFGLGGARHAIWVMDQVEKRHPKAPHWYLQVIGTDPDKQGMGFGSVAMRRHLAIADASGLPCYLESSKEKNIPIYASFGFEVTEEIKLIGGPTLYAMWRKARAAS